MKHKITFLFITILVAFIALAACDSTIDSNTTTDQNLTGPDVLAPPSAPSPFSNLSDSEWYIIVDQSDQTQDTSGNWNGVESVDPNMNFYSFWTDGNGTAQLTMIDHPDNANGALYKGQWTNIGCTVMGQGRMIGSPNAKVKYESNVDLAGANFYLSLYGWAKCSDSSDKTCIEYYVVENYNGDYTNFINTISGSTPTELGSRVIDGSRYHVFRTVRINKPWIFEGLGTFWQYWSIRENKRHLGTINFKKHVELWNDKGMRLVADDFAEEWIMDNPSDPFSVTGHWLHYYQIMAIEGNGSSGQITMSIEDWTNDN